MVLVLSLRAGAVRLNLQDAAYVFHFDRWSNASVEVQAEDRSLRKAIEERIDVVLRRKRRLFQDIVDDVTLDVGSALTGAELFSLFGLSVPTVWADPDRAH